MINNFLEPELKRKHISRDNLWFQQDGVTANTARASMEAIRALFRVVSRFGDIHWPPRSPGLSICDIFLWGYLKSRVYEGKPRTLKDLETVIREKIEDIYLKFLNRMVANFRETLQKLVSVKMVITSAISSSTHNILKRHVIMYISI